MNLASLPSQETLDLLIPLISNSRSTFCGCARRHEEGVSDKKR